MAPEPLERLVAWLAGGFRNALSPRTRRNLRRELRGSALAKIGIVLLVVVLLLATFAPLVAPWNPTKQDTENAQQPPLGFSRQTTEVRPGADGGIEETEVFVNASVAHPLGTDGLGRDMLSRVIYGARTSIVVGIAGTVLAMLLGVPVGLVAGYYRGRIDDSLMRIADVSLAFPSLVLAIALVGLFGQAAVKVPDPLTMEVAGTSVAGAIRGVISLPGGLTYPTGMPETFTLPGTVIVVVGLVNWVWFARVARGEALGVREEEYVKAARSLGASDSFVIRKHVLPNSLTPILVLGTIQVAAIILLESALSFLGFSGTTLSWGFDISQGRQYQTTSWWIAAMPGLAIVLTVIGINLIGDWLRDALDPGIEGEGGGV
jgi:peptide/nickel transport system permease protein